MCHICMPYIYVPYICAICINVPNIYVFYRRANAIHILKNSSQATSLYILTSHKDQINA